uniref:Ligated ion channel binding I - glutamate n=1 Tax=Polyphagotarsonemus latus TaxID=1204166 RepID=A0AAN0LP71_9ACAR
MAIWDLKTIICSSTITVRSSTDKKHNFMGILGPVYESNFPRSVFNVTSFDSKDCNVGHRFSNGSFNGMYKEIIDKNLDLGIFSSKHQLLYEEFTYSPVKGYTNKYRKNQLQNFGFTIDSYNYNSNSQFTNYILASLSVLLIELDKSVYLNNLQDLLVSKMYQPFFYTEDIEDYFKFSSKKLNKDIWKLYKKRNTKVYTVCNRANDFKLILRCMITMKRTKIVLIFEKRLLSMFGPAYCSNAHQYIERQDPYVIQYSKQLEEILTFIPFNKKMKREKKIFLDK